MEDAFIRSGDHTLSGADSLGIEEWICAQYRDLGPGLRRYLVRLLGESGSAEDIVQEVFLRLYEAVRQEQRIENLRSWTFQVGHNMAIDQQRRRDVEWWAARAFRREELRADAPNSETALLQAERRRLVQAALSLVTPQERQVLELRAEGLRYREIAEVMGLHVSTVSTFLLRAVRKIARQING